MTTTPTTPKPSPRPEQLPVVDLVIAPNDPPPKRCELYKRGCPNPAAFRLERRTATVAAPGLLDAQVCSGCLLMWVGNWTANGNVVTVAAI